MNSPGRIRQLRITVQDSHGTTLGGVTLANPGQLTRVDVEETILLPRIRMEVWGGNNACGTYLYPYSV